MTLQGNIANYNYIDDPANPDYYSYNNNFLNDNNILRALSFLQSALENNDSVRIRKAIEYIDGVENKLLRFRAEVGARLNKVESMEKIYLDRETEVKTYLSHDRDADIAELVSSLEQKQAALAGFRSLSSELFSLSLFDFIR